MAARRRRPGRAAPPRPGQRPSPGLRGARHRGSRRGTALPIAGTFVPDPGAPLPEPTAAPTPLAPQDQAEAVARIIVERAYERLMRAVPGR